MKVGNVAAPNGLSERAVWSKQENKSASGAQFSDQSPRKEAPLFLLCGESETKILFIWLSIHFAQLHRKRLGSKKYKVIARYEIIHEIENYV